MDSSNHGARRFPKQRTWTLVIRQVIQRILNDSQARSFLRSSARNIVFSKTLFRIRLAYGLGAMRYGLFTAVQPEASR